MADEEPAGEFIAPDSFEWDDNKSTANLAKHGIAFDDASEVFYGPVVVRQSNRNDEERWLAIGEAENRLIAVVFTRRGSVIQIISARRARKNEEREYRNQEMGRSSQGQD